jgi:2-polyprenyl-3-methyl-5-hydroxy-6-metoxy-1,4-benzoquinol methylase
MRPIPTSLPNPHATAADSPETSRHYWEDRARRYAAHDGLPAVCAYGMPWFYNRYIAATQRLALRRWLNPLPCQQVLDVGCGVGRWSLLLARSGARVTGVDLSDHMLARARERAAAAGLDTNCTFEQSDAAALKLGRRFDRILVVTVIQHILDPLRAREAIARLRDHLAPGATLVMLEAAPTQQTRRCDTAVFHARTEALYREWFRDAGLRVIEVSGVDPAPFKTWFLPCYRKLPRPLGQLLMLAVTLLSLPVDVIFGRIAARYSWHKVFVLQRAENTA